MNCIKLNWFKIIISVSFLLLLVAVGYYFVFLVPAQKREREYLEGLRVEKEYLENQLACRNAGYEYWIRKKQEDELNRYGSEPEYKFNRKLNTCIINISHYNYLQTSQRLEVIDIYQNKVLLRYDTDQNPNDGKWRDRHISWDEWNTQKDILFAE